MLVGETENKQLYRKNPKMESDTSQGYGEKESRLREVLVGGLL